MSADASAYPLKAAAAGPRRDWSWTSVTLVLLAVMLCGSLMKLTHAKQKFCGKTLNEAMDLLCVNGYNIKLSSSASASSLLSPPPQKRRAPAIAPHLDSHDMLEYELSDNEPSLLPIVTYSLSPFLANMYGKSLAQTRRRRDGGVYDECCRQACSYTELAAYCRAP